MRIEYALMNKVLKVGIIGLGNQSLNDQIPTILRREDTQITCVCDKSMLSQKIFKEIFPSLNNTAIYSDYQKMIEENNLDFVYIAIPHDQYIPVVKLLCKNKIYFMKEKPYARDLIEAQKMFAIEGYTKYGFICTQRRYNKLYNIAKDSIPQLGKVYLFNSVYKLNIEDPSEGWRGDKKIAGGGCILDMGYHIIDQLIWWFGYPQRLFAKKSSFAVPGKIYDAEDTATIAFSYESGLHGSILLSRHAGEKKEEYVLYGSNGSIEGNKKILFLKDKNGRTLKAYNLENDIDMLDNQLRTFISVIRDKGDFLSIHEQNMLDMEFIDSCYKSDDKISFPVSVKSTSQSYNN